MRTTLANVTQLMECHLKHQRVMGSIPGQGIDQPWAN